MSKSIVTLTFAVNTETVTADSIRNAVRRNFTNAVDLNSLAGEVNGIEYTVATAETVSDTAVRDWALAKGVAVGARGKVPAALKAAYVDAH